MFALSSERLSRRRLMCGIAASVLLHVLLVVFLVFVAKGGFGEVPTVKRGEPLFVELPNINEPAPRGNPAAKEAGPPPGASAASKPTPPAPPAAPAPAPRAPAAPPVVAKAPPAPVTPAPRAPAPTPPVTPPAPAPTVAEKAPAPEPAPSRSQPEEVARPAEPTRTAKESAPPSPPTGAQDARTPPGDQRTAMIPPSGSRGSSGAPDMRSALRRGAGGGAGGTSDGRGGIEGEPIPLDSRDPRYSDYLDRIRRMIKEKWGYPCVKNDSTQECEYKTALLVIEFGIARDGKVPFVNVIRTSGFPIYDDYAVNAIKFAQPFPKVPDTMGSRAGVPIVATFSYQVDRSLVNLLR